MDQKTVLVVEDETVLRKILEKKLIKEGFTVLSASDGNEALIIALNKKPHLILLDVMMPHNGLLMLQELRKDTAYGKKVPVILLTNLSPDTKDIVEAIEKHEPIFYLVKANYTLEQVVDRVHESLV